MSNYDNPPRLSRGKLRRNISAWALISLSKNPCFQRVKAWVFS